VISSISEIKVGDLIKIDSAEGGIIKAPVEFKVAGIYYDEIISDRDQDRGYRYKLDIANHVVTVESEIGKAHRFSK